MSDKVEEISVTTFRSYLRCNTMHPNPNYTEAVKFLCGLADDVGLKRQVLKVVDDNPIVVMTWTGTDSLLPSLLLNSHMDVVPVFMDHWTHHPFSAHKDEQGNIFARGAQDMKCVGVQYVEAIRRLKQTGQTFARTIHILFVPDEEVGGGLGMGKFVDTDEFRQLNVGFALDEGIATPESTYQIFNAERVKWWLKVTCKGNPGHGSKFVENTAAEKFQKVINQLLEFREQERKKLASDPKLSLGDVATLNLTMVSGGVQVNVVPAELRADFDIRVPPSYDLDAYEKKFLDICTEAGPDVKAEYLQFFKLKTITKVDDSNFWWKAFSGAMNAMNLKYETKVFVGGTDARFLRQLGVPALGFSPMVDTPQLLHDHNEYLNENVFLKGVDIYTKLIPALANARE